MKKKKLQKNIARRVHQIRMDKGISEIALAKLIGKERAVIYRIESGTVNPTIYFLREIAGGLGVKLEELLKGVK